MAGDGAYRTIDTQRLLDTCIDVWKLRQVLDINRCILVTNAESVSPFNGSLSATNYVFSAEASFQLQVVVDRSIKMTYPNYLVDLLLSLLKRFRVFEEIIE